MGDSKTSDKKEKLCCLCASWIAANCLDDFEGEPCHKICKAEGVGRAHKTRHVEPVQCCMPNESAIEGFCYFAETRREWDRCWDRCEKQSPLSHRRHDDPPHQIRTHQRSAPSARGELEEKPVARLIERPRGTGKQQRIEYEVVLSPLTDDTFMDEGDEAWPLYKKSQYVEEKK